MNYITLSIGIINIIFILAMIFIERRKPEIIISWLVLFTVFPIGGFVLYVLFGSGLSFKTRRMLRRKVLYHDAYEKFIWEEKRKALYLSPEIKELVKFNQNEGDCTPYFGNSVQVFTNGIQKMQSLKQDLLNAKHSINMEYYIFDDKGIGKQIMQILCKKAKEGVKVRLIYDSVGSLRSPRRFFRKLKNAGGEVVGFFPPLFGIRLINLKMNYRNHRKIVVIDGIKGYTGGINIRDDHMGLNKKLSPWRDTHIKIEGTAVYELQNVFFNDWFFCKKKRIPATELVFMGYFPAIKKCGNTVCQIETSGPETKLQAIKDSYVKMISSAKEQVVLESPYFVPDDAFINAIKQAIRSGVKVKVLIPNVPDKKFVYLASLSFARDILEAGAEIYLYKGFLHSKMLLVDDKCVSIGSCNADNRSFALNFEINAFLYDKNFITDCQKIVDEDLENSIKVDIEYFKQKTVTSKLGQAIFRMFAPLL